MDYSGFFIGWIRLVFLRLFRFLRIRFFSFKLSALGLKLFQDSVSVFSRDQIIRALQQYKDAKRITLLISYSTEQVKPSIFGVKRAINGFFGLLRH